MDDKNVLFGVTNDYDFLMASSDTNKLPEEKNNLTVNTKQAIPVPF